MSVQLSFANKVVVVSGGSRGIGAATVKMFVEAGGKAVFNYQKNKDAADKVVASCGAANTHAVQAELNSSDSAKKLIDEAVARFGRVDAVVANHGIWVSDDVRIDKMSDEQWRRTIAINLDSVFGLAKYGVAQMKRQKSGGNVVFVSSTSAQRGEAFHVDYAASKGAVISMTKGLSTELAPEKIRVNCVAPGWVYTDMSAPALDDAKVGKWVMDSIPMGRAGSAAEIAAPILFLCTEHAGFITGEIFNVNGGAVLIG